MAALKKLKVPKLVRYAQRRMEAYGIETYRESPLDWANLVVNPDTGEALSTPRQFLRDASRDIEKNLDLNWEDATPRERETAQQGLYTLERIARMPSRKKR